MPKTHEVPTEPLPEGYPPERVEHISELVEAMRASDDPKERDRLADELALFIFGPADE